LISELYRLRSHNKFAFRNYARVDRIKAIIDPREGEKKVFIDDMLAKQHIRHSTTPYGSGIMMFLKPDGATSACVNHHKLNQLLLLDNLVLPLIDDSLFP
jgi:hypothetical protein